MDAKQKITKDKAQDLRKKEQQRKPDALRGSRKRLKVLVESENKRLKIKQSNKEGESFCHRRQKY